ADDLGRVRRRGKITAHVGAGAERARAGPRDHHAAAAPAVELVPQPGEVRHHRAGHGVEPWLVVEREHDDVTTVLANVDLHAQSPSSPGTTTTLPYARRSVSKRIASTLFSRGRRWEMQGRSLPSSHQRSSSSTDMRSLSGACQRK